MLFINSNLRKILPGLNIQALVNSGIHGSTTTLFTANFKMKDLVMPVQFNSPDQNQPVDHDILPTTEQSPSYNKLSSLLRGSNINLVDLINLKHVVRISLNRYEQVSENNSRIVKRKNSIIRTVQRKLSPEKKSPFDIKKELAEKILEQNNIENAISSLNEFLEFENGRFSPPDKASLITILKNNFINTFGFEVDKIATLSTNHNELQQYKLRINSAFDDALKNYEGWFNQYRTGFCINIRHTKDGIARSRDFVLSVMEERNLSKKLILIRDYFEFNKVNGTQLTKNIPGCRDHSFNTFLLALVQKHTVKLRGTSQENRIRGRITIINGIVRTLNALLSEYEEAQQTQDIPNRQFAVNRNLPSPAMMGARDAI